MNLKLIALPREHGAWGYVLEPLILGLLAAFSVKGLYLAFGALLAFLAHQPVRIYFSAQQNTKKASLLFLLMYGIPAVLFFALFIYKTNPLYFLPFTLAIVFMLIYLFMELAGFGRKMVTHMIPPTAIDLIAVSIVLVSGWELLETAAFLVLLSSRAHPTTFYVRAKLRRREDKEYYKVLAVAVHLLSLCMASLLVYLKIMPGLALIAVFLLFIRAVIGVYFNKTVMTPKQIGIREFIYGALFVFISAAGYHFQI